MAAIMAAFLVASAVGASQIDKANKFSDILNPDMEAHEWTRIAESQFGFQAFEVVLKQADWSNPRVQLMQLTIHQQISELDKVVAGGLMWLHGPCNFRQFGPMAFAHWSRSADWAGV